MARKSLSLGKSFDRLFGSALASHISDGLLATSAPLLATTLTKDPILIAGLSALVMLPWLLFGIPIGGLLDRVNRRYALAASSIVKLASAAGISLAIATGTVNIWMLYIASFLIGISEVFADTAMQSMLPQLLKPNQIETANSRLNIAQTVLGNFIGTPLGGLLYAVAIWIPFALNGLGFAVGAALVLLIPLKVKIDWDNSMMHEAKAKSKFSEDIKFGIKYLWEHKVMLRLVLTTTAIALLYSASTSTLILFLLNVHHMPAALFGVILTIQGIGSILGSMHAPAVSSRFGRPKVLAVSLVSSTFLLGVIGYLPNLIWIAIFGFLHQYAISFWNILLMSTYHELIPNHLFGRIHGTRRTLVWGMMPVGSLLGGWIATYDLRAPFLLTLVIGTVVAVTAVPFLVSLPVKQKLAEDDGASAV